MKLWLKQTLICLLVIMLAFCACLYFFIVQQTQQMLDDAQNSALQNTNVFCEHLSTLDRTSNAGYGTDETTLRALIQYTFSSYAHLLQSKDCSYSLVMEDTYLYNISAYQPMQLLPVDEQVITAQRLVEMNGVPLLVTARNTIVLNLPITVYTVQDASDTFARIDTLTRNAQLALLACLLLSGILLPLTLRRTLRPLRKLTQVSEEISGGEYSLRSKIKSQDEVGELSSSFDHMAETVEQKILDLEEQARRRELLLGALTHEMKTPMTAIIGFSDSLISMPLTEEKRMEASHEIHEAALRTERLSQKMMQLIAMTDCPVLVKRRLSVDDLFQQIQSVMQESLANKELSLSAHAECRFLQGDADLIICLLTNLIDNAIKASQPGQEISITASESDIDYQLSVSDHGSGIPADKIALVTEPFYRVDKARSRKMGGAGLGLSLCQMIAQAHGGSLQIESTVSSGTTITMVWPKEGSNE